MVKTNPYQLVSALGLAFCMGSVRASLLRFQAIVKTFQGIIGYFHMVIVEEMQQLRK
jgi:hypothetical protein